MKLTKEDTIKAIELCFSRNGCGECPLGCPDEDCSDLLLKNALHYLKENEPAPSANDTSSNNNSLSQLNDTAKLRICQEQLGRLKIELTCITYSSDIECMKERILQVSGALEMISNIIAGDGE